MNYKPEDPFIDYKNRLQTLPDGMKIFLFIGILLLFLIVSSMVGAIATAAIFGFPLFPFDSIMGNISGDNNAQIIYQIFSSIGLFVLPSLLYSKHFELDGKAFLKLSKKPNIKIVLFTVLIFISANFVMDLLVKLMHFVPFEDMQNPFIASLLELENQSTQVLKQFLVFTSPLKFILVFFTMAVIPAIGEELTFRGVFFNLFYRSSKNIGFAALISGLLFSFIHFQIHNLLALVFIGTLLAYIYYLTENLWVSVLAHMFNNGIIVVLSYANNLGYITYDFTQVEDLPLYASFAGTGLFIGLFFLYRKFVLTQKQHVL